MLDNENKPPSKAKWLADIEILADVLMAGDDRATRYLKEGSQEERTARIAMAKLLRSELLLRKDFRDRLAALFDPDDGTHLAIDRKLVFRHRAAGRSRDHTRNTAIAECIYNNLRKGHGVEDAIKKAMKSFGMGKKAIEKIWYGDKKLNDPGFRKLLEQIYGPLPKQKRGPKKKHRI